MELGFSVEAEEWSGGHGGENKGFLWHLGEEDGGDKKLGTDYGIVADGFSPCSCSLVL